MIGPQRPDTDGGGATATAADPDGWREPFQRFCTAHLEVDVRRAAAEVLDHPGGRTAVVEHHADPDDPLRPQVLRLARHDVFRRVDAGQPWTAAAAEWMSAVDATWQESASYCADVAWYARQARASVLLSLDEDTVLHEDPSTVTGRSLVHLYLCGLRFDFRCARITDFFNRFARPLEELDPYTRSLHAFGLLGQGDEHGLRCMDDVLAADSSNVKLLHALMQGLWLGEELPGQAERILEILQRPQFSARNDPIALLREAYAYRKLGDFARARAAIERGMALLDPTAVEVHEQFGRERDSILAAQELRAQAQRDLEALRSVVTEEIDRARREIGTAVAEGVRESRKAVESGQLKVVEVLSVFTALIALLAGSGASVVIGSLTWWQRAVLILVTAVACCGFFLILRHLVGVRTPPGRDR
ncbi:hypothetical protein [Streptomyces thermolineatus]|uniref:hypothetical protein n=1 Tax=Streptomyces thermolineatus TaxID=44033 RepID=UPI00384A9525